MEHKLSHPSNAEQVQLWIDSLMAKENLERLEREEDFYYGADPKDTYEDYDRYALDFDYGTGVRRY